MSDIEAFNGDPLKRQVLFRTPSGLNDDAIILTGLAETLQRRLEDACSEDVIEDAAELSWSYEALAQLANALALKLRAFGG